MNFLSNLVTSYKNQLKGACRKGDLSSIQKILGKNPDLLYEVNLNSISSLF